MNPSLASTTTDATPASPGLKALWLDLLECQTAMTLPFELPHYYGLQEWLACPAVLDLGTGPGYYLNELARLFPEKRYRGVDLDAGYIGVARERRHPSVSFDVADIFSVSDRVPFVIARLVAQHLPSLEDFLTKIRELLIPGGCFLSVEPDDRLRMFYPRLPATERMFSGFSRLRRDEGYDRSAGLLMGPLASSCGLDLVRQASVIVPSYTPTYADRFLRFHHLIVRVFSEAFGMNVERAEVLRELADWIANPRAYAQLGVHLAIYRRVG